MSKLQKTLVTATITAVVAVAGIYYARQTKNLRTLGQKDAGLGPPTVLSSAETASLAKSPTVSTELPREITPEIRSLLAKLQSSDTGTQVRAIQAIGKLGPNGGEAVPALVPLLSDENESIRMLTARALGKIGFNAKEALPALRNYATTSSLTERTLAENAIEKIEN